MLLRLGSRYRKWSSRLLITPAFQLGCSAISAQCLTLLVSPLLTRLYPPSAFGDFSLYAAWLGFFSVASTLRYDLAIGLPSSDDEAYDLVGLSILCATLTATLAIPCAYGMAQSNIVTANVRLLLFLGPSVLLAGAMFAGTTWSLRANELSPISLSKVTQAILRAITQLVFGAAGFGPIGLVSGELAGKIGGNLALWTRIARVAPITFPRHSGRYIAAATKYRNFATLSTISTLVGQVSLLLPSVLFYAMLGSTVAGYISIAQRVLAIPFEMIAHTLSSIYIGKVSLHMRTQQGCLRTTFFKTVAGTAALSIVPFGLFAAFSPVIFPIAFGPEWFASGQYARILTTAYMLQFIMSPVAHTLNLMQCNRLQVQFDLFRILVLGGCTIVSFSVFGSAHATVIAYTVAASTMQAVHLAITALAVVSHTKANHH